MKREAGTIRVEKIRTRYWVRRTRLAETYPGRTWQAQLWSGQRGWVPFGFRCSYYHSRAAAEAVAEQLRVIEALLK
jgi:hypothetical protein